MDHLGTRHEVARGHSTRLLNKQRGKSATELYSQFFFLPVFARDDKGYLKSECKDRAVRRGQVFQGKLTPVCEFPFVCFDVKFLFPVQEDQCAKRH